MKVNVVDVETCKKILEIEVAHEVVKEAIESAYDNLGKNAVLAGFRRGKVPLDLLRSHYQEQVRKDVLGRLIQESFHEAVAFTKVVPVTDAKLESVNFSDDQPLSYKAHVEVRGQIQLGAYDNLTARGFDLKVKDEEIKKTLQEVRERFAEYISIKDRGAAKGDYVLLDFDGLVEGKPFQGSQVKDYFIELGSEVAIPGFEDQLIGVTVSEERSVQAKFPDDFPNKELAAKTAVFKVKVKELKEKRLAPLDDAFAHFVGVTSLAVLTETIKENIQKEKEEQAKIAIVDQLLKQLVESSIVDVPPSLLERQLVRLAVENDQALKKQNLSYKDLGMDWEGIKKQLAQKALTQVKVSLILETIADREKIEVSEDEVSAEVLRYAQETKRDYKQVRKELEEKGIFASIEGNLRDGKTVDFLLSRTAIDYGSTLAKVS